jgi:hypothetical protein
MQETAVRQAKDVLEAAADNGPYADSGPAKEAEVEVEHREARTQA